MKTIPAAVRSPLLQVLVCWAVFLAFSSRVWPHMGIGYGEESGAAAALDWIRQSPARGFHFGLFGWNIPLMSQVYQGPWVIYGLAPFVALCGATLASLRFYTASMFLLALWGTHRLARDLCRSESAAFLAMLLLAVCPTMTTFCGRNTFPVPGIAFSVWTLSFGLSFARTRKPIFACLSVAAFFAGLGCHSCFAALGAGLLLAFVLMPRRWLALLPEGRRERLELLAGCLACAGIFLLPMVVFNALNGDATLHFLMSHLAARAPWGCSSNVGSTCSNLDYFTNLKERFRELALLCDGDRVATKLPWHIAYAAGLLLSLTLTAREAWRRRTLWFAPAVLWTTVIGYLLISPISPTDQNLAHMVPLAPIGAVLMFSWLSFIPRGRSRGALLAAGALLCAAQLAGDLLYLNADNVDPPNAVWYGESPLVIEVCRWAAARPRSAVVPLDVSLFAALPYFSDGRARLPYPDHFGVPGELPWNQWLRRRDKPYFLTENDAEGSAYLAALKGEAARIGARLVRVKIFPDRFGRSEFEVYRVQ